MNDTGTDTGIDPGTDTPLELAEGFPSLTHEQWQGLAAKVLNRKAPPDRQVDGPTAEAKLRTTTVDGLVINPVYSPDGDVKPLGVPGAMPFTRGNALRDPQQPWDVRQVFDNPDPAAAAQEVLTDLERGVTSLWLRVGPGAIPADKIADVLADVELDLAAVVVSAVGDSDAQRATAAALRQAWDERGAAKTAVSGGFGIDPIGAYARYGGDLDLAAVAEEVRVALDEYPKVRALVVDATAYHDAGAADVDELGCAVATGVAYLRELDAAGISPEQAFGQIEFRVAATADQFLTIAKLRALRRLWARVGEACGVPEKARGAYEHAVSSWRMMTRDDPWVNMLRGTVACFGAAVGGAESITILPFDSVIGIPDVLGRRVARNTQIVLAEESNLGLVTDQAGGSWYVEALTDDLAVKAWAWLQEIEAAGGMAQALTDGLVAQRLAQRTADRDVLLANRRQPITGVSMFPMVGEVPLVRPARPAGPSGQGPLTPRRDSEIFEALRDRSTATAKESGSPPKVLLVCLGSRRDFGAREGFASNVLAVAGIETPRVESSDPAEIAEAARTAGATAAVLCSNATVYAAQGKAAADALRGAGVGTVLIAGQAKELGDDAGCVDGMIRDGIDIVATLSTLLNDLGAAR